MNELDYLLNELLAENDQINLDQIPTGIADKRRLLRSLLNIRPPHPISKRFIERLDVELKYQALEKGIVSLEDIPASKTFPEIKLWQGDITRLKAEAIVNAANSQMLGCFAPLHGCIDNAIHSAAGVQLRMECHKLMQEQGYEEPTGGAKITKGYNLPAKYVIHTVGPIIRRAFVSAEEENQLASCYKSALYLATQHQLTSIAFCCISTGEFRFPNRRASEIAVNTVTSFLKENPDTTLKTIVFNVFKDIDYDLYNELLK